MRLAHFGTFDVENFGDLLFPAILEERLRGRFSEVLHVSPLGGPAVWGDTAQTVSVDDAWSSKRGGDAVVLGGGNLIHASPAGAQEYVRKGWSLFWPTRSLARSLPAGRKVASASVLECHRHFRRVAAPLPHTAAFVAWAASTAAYVSVRDEPSAAELVAGGATADAVVPDTALEVAGLWTRSQLRRSYRDAFTVRGHPVPQRTIALHINQRYAMDPPAALACRLDSMATAAGATPILLGLGPCHGDDELQDEVGSESGRV